MYSNLLGSTVFLCVCKMESDCSDLESSSDKSLEEVVLEEEDHEHILVSRGEVSKNTTG